MVTQTKPLTARREAFCQSIVDGLSQTEAYRVNYHVDGMIPATVHNNAYMLAQKSEISARISELKTAVDAQIVAKRVWDKSRFIDEAESNLSQSRRLDQMAPANSALSLIGKATGILADEVKTIDTALDAVLKVAAAMTEVHLRALADGRPVPGDMGPVVEGKGKMVEE